MLCLLPKFHRKARDHSLEAQALDHAEIKSYGVSWRHSERSFAIGLRTRDKFDDPSLISIENLRKPQIQTRISLSKVVGKNELRERRMLLNKFNMGEKHPL